jgi:glutamate dehydrogenase (NADP+)
MVSLWPFVQANPQYGEYALLERLVEPERVIQFRVAWVDDRGQTQVNRAFRVQHSSAIGPFKGGMRFHPSVNLSILKFLAFEQTLKNSLTTLPMGGGKGGSDFDPKGKSDPEVMRFCQALMSELYRHLGSQIDVPAGDSASARANRGRRDESVERHRLRLHRQHIAWRQPDPPRGTGYSTVHFRTDARRRAKTSSMRCRSPDRATSPNSPPKAIDMGARVSRSRTRRTVVDRDGFDTEKLQALMELKNVKRGRLSEFAARFGLAFEAGKRPWHVPTDIALPCATENELDERDAATLVANGVVCVAEGANMPCTPQAMDTFLDAGTLYAPGKASNAGGVAVSGLEMSQNAQRLSWSAGEVDERLHAIMMDIHENCVRHGKREDGSIKYVAGANIAGFVKVADAMLMQGVY